VAAQHCIVSQLKDGMQPMVLHFAQFLQHVD
jgi:hypothetical protein